VARELLAAADRARVTLDRARDSGPGTSDHREVEPAGLRGVTLGVRENPCRHTACDTRDRLRPGAFRRALRVVEAVLGR
jgi:hypothetical protein